MNLDGIDLMCVVIGDMQSHFSEHLRRCENAICIILFIIILFFVCTGCSNSQTKETFGFKRHVIYYGFRVDTVDAADFNKDGVLDVVAGGEKGGIWLEAPTWIPHKISLKGYEKGDLELSYIKCLDVDSDKDTDIIACYYWGPIFWLECPEKPDDYGWNFRIVDDRVKGIHGLDLGDIDRDGKIDLVANSAQPGEIGESMVWYHIPNDPNSAQHWKRFVLGDGDAGGGTHYPHLADIDNDGDLDVVIGARSGNWFAWWECPLAPESLWHKHLIAENERGATNILCADIDADGLSDFVASLGHSAGVFWYQAPSWSRNTIDRSIKGPHSLGVADFDNDGDLDVASCGKDNKVISWYENDGRGNFEIHEIFNDQAAYDLRVIDLDLDGDIDILVGGEHSRNVVWYENTKIP
jgi:hypothetical protein